MGDDFDTILTKLGTGKWNILFLVAMCYWYSLLPYHTMVGLFLAPYVGHTCRLPPHAHTVTLVLPADAAHTPENTTYESQPTQQNTEEASCSFLVEDPATGRLENEPCTEWDFDNSTSLSTVTSEFQLVCGRKYLRATYQSLYMFGMLVGAGFNAFLADKYGRYTLVAISAVVYSLVSIVSAWLPSLSWLMAARFVLGLMHPATLQTGFILVLEVTEVKMRTKIGLFQVFSWSVATMLYSGWAYLLREWRWLHMAVSLPSLLFMPFLFLMCESPRWLAVVGQHQRALKELRRAAAWNKVTLPPDQELLAIMQRVQEQAVSHRETDAPTKSRLHQARDQVAVLCRTPKIRLITVVMCIGYFVVAMLFFGLTLGGSALGVSNPFVYVAISATVELPAYTILIPFVIYFGNRKMLILNFFLCAVALLVRPLIPEDLNWLSVTLVMMGKMGSSSAFAILFLYAVELNPTEIRTQGMGAAMVSSRAGAFVSAYIITALETSNQWVMSVVFGAAALVAGVAVLPLWETQNTRLPDTLAELEGTKPDMENSEGDRKEPARDEVTRC